MKKNLFLMFVLLCAAAQGAWADEWDAVYTMTQTTSSNWTALDAGSTTGQTLGSAGTTTYYYVNSNLTFTNSSVGGSGLTIKGTVYLYIPSGKTLTCTGANASGQTGAGAGIELTEGNTLNIIGSGTLNATGGNAANGGNGVNGGNAECTYDVSILGGSGGNGGNGGGGAGAGIGTRGANGGIGGNGGQRNGSYGQETTQYGVDGNAGSAGSTAGAMGNLYLVTSSVNLSATGGNAGSNGTGGNRGLTASQHPDSNVYMASGGGGGGAGGFGGAACNIGTGGPGGGGGGGGAAGNVAWVVYSGTANGYYHAGAKGGHGGTNGNNTSAPDGTSIELDNPKHADIQAGGLRPNASDYDDDDGWENGNAWHDGGAGGDCGYISLALWPFLGAGSEDNPYLINSADDWTSFAHNVSNGNNYSGKYVKLTNDISVTTMAGGYQADDNYQPFSGTFDGDGHTLTLNVNNQSRFAAPFKCVSGATIKNLRTAGTIDGTGNSDGKLLAGIIGVSFGNTTITGCRSSVTLTTGFGEDAAMAGLVAGTKGGSLTIEGCVFDGSMTGASNTHCAGIAGYDYPDVGGTNTTISNCLFAPTTLTVSTADDGYTKTISRDADATITNCYYTQTLGTAQGTEATASATAPPFLGALLHDYGFVKAYAAGLLMDGNYYYDARIITSESTTLTTGTYTVNGNVTVPSRIQINGTVVLNLSEDATLHAPKGIEVDYLNSANLTINGPGTLTIDNCNLDKSGIGSVHVGTIVINGGTINVNGGAGGAGIGGDNHNIDGGYITINGGVVNATGGNFAAGIGGGNGPGTGDEPSYWGPCGVITINGGQVTAIGGYSGPGIGPGNNFILPVNGTLTLGWTHSEDFVYSTGYVADPNAPWKTSIRQISFVAGKQFMIDGTATIATEENLKSSGTTKIVPYEAGQQTLSGSGTDGDPYLISSTADWNKFVHNVLDGNSYNSQYVKLMADIDITKCVSVYDDNAANARPFSGTFLGNNHTITATITDNLHGGTAPFRYISGATIKNLTVAGTIASNQNHTSGLVGFASGTNLIEGCNVSATIDIESDYSGGLVGHGLTSTTTIKDCIFSGHYNGRDVIDHYTEGENYSQVPVYRGPNNIASFWGWNDDGASPMLQNCLEKGTYTNIGSMHPMGLQGGSGTISQPCYYLNPQIGSPTNACAVSGAYQAYTVNTVEGEMLRPLVLVDGNTYYTPCLIAAADYYHRTGSSVGVTPVVTASNGTPLTLGTDYTATLNGEAVAAFPIVITTLGTKTFTITGQGNCNGSKSISFIVYGFDGEGTEESPYIISNTDQWDAFASEVNLGNACSGKHVKLTADISVTTMVGYRVNDSDNKPFSATFNGDGHTITATIRGNSNQGNAPFRYIDGATIRNLTIAGTIASNQHYSSGLVGFASGTNLIEDCIVTATLNIRNDSYVGGFVGHGLSSTTTIRNCIFAGGIYGIDSYLTHAGSFWGWSDNATPTLENCVEMGYYNDRVYGMHPMGLLGGNGTLSNCYYKNTPTRNPTNAWTITPNSDYGRIYTEPSATEIRKSITINGTTVYSDNCTVSGVTLTYLTNDAITPVVTEPYNSIALTLGTNYTVTLDGEPVESFPLTLTTSGNHTLIISGIGSYMGSKRFNIVVSDPIEGDGTHDTPYLISNDENWILFTSYVNSGTTTYSGKYVKLMADINVSDMVGTSESKSFQGTFLGNGHTLTFSRGSSQNHFDENYCAPFRYVKNATIQDLKVAGSIYTSQMYAGGLVAESFGTTNINNCQVGIFIRTCNYTWPEHGGIVSYATGTLNITGCVFNGRLLNIYSGVINCGGILGRTSSSATVKISNTLYAPAPASGENVINTGSTFVQTIYDNTFTLTNCYYTETMGKAQGTQVYTISGGTGVTVSNAGTVRNEYSVSGLTFYTTGIKYNDVLYGGNGSNVSLTLTNNRPGYFARYAASAGTLTDTGNPYTLTMPDENVTISVAEWVEITFPGSGTAGDPYTISNSDEWNNFAYNVNSGNNFSGKYVRLDADIAITNMCGTVSGYTPEHAFSGTFLGDGHTITAALDDDGNQGLAPFRYINGATIKDLKVAGTIASSQYHTSGLVGFANGTNTIEDCLVTATLNITSNYAGGIIGHGLNSNTTIRGCAFAGTINGVDVERENIGGIWGWSTSGTPTLLNCLENGTYTNIASMHPMGLQGATGTITNCYYLNAQTGSPRNVCTVSGAKQAYTAATTPANLGSEVQNYGTLTAYENGILYDGKYYVAPASISLANAADNSTTISNANGYVANVTLADRTLYKDGAWNTLCLPFNVNNFTGTPLEGATVKTLASTGFSDGTLTMNFTEDLTGIEAGKPYIVKWANGTNIVNPVFNGVTISNAAANAETDYVDFVGTYSPVDIYTAEKTNLYLGADNNLYYPWGDAMNSFYINSFRAYFQLLNGLTAGDPGNGVRAINLNFGEGSEETIISPAEIAERADAWYTIDGVKLNGKPNVKGLYINNGRKVVIK